MLNLKRAVGRRELITRGLVIGVVLSSALILSACYHGKSTSSNQTSTTAQSQANQQATSEPEEGAIVITATDAGFTPAQVTVKSGGKVAYTNNSSAKIQVASDPHPVHTANDELTEGDFVMEIAPGASATVTLTKTGTWGYHAHLNPGIRGKIVVE